MPYFPPFLHISRHCKNRRLFPLFQTAIVLHFADNVLLPVSDVLTVPYLFVYDKNSFFLDLPRVGKRQENFPGLAPSGANARKISRDLPRAGQMSGKFPGTCLKRGKRQENFPGLASSGANARKISRDLPQAKQARRA